MGAALVTGAGRGLGMEIARALAARGLTVHLTDVDSAAAEAAARELGPPAFPSALDVRDAEACRAAAAQTAERGGSLDVWVNNAGILVTGHVWEHDAETRRALFEVNTLGTINGTLAALELMRATGRGQVINVVSLAGLGAPPGEALYSATKHGAIAFSLGALHDLRRAGFEQIHVSAVCPDGIWTPMISDRLDDPGAAPSFSGRLLRAETVAPQVVALLDHPRPVLAIPRWRGLFVRFLDAFPRLTSRLMPLFMADARRRQRRWKKRVEAGKEPH
ncbi:MAG TPA: SDR family NAD(P)-dependent oxidoreductase [Solirubrobacterales bacterium]|nr:SDR family NAD(P)-dependent oxidoreductase [Solirubrobacterales bacterium]